MGVDICQFPQFNVITVVKRRSDANTQHLKWLPSGAPEQGT